VARHPGSLAFDHRPGLFEQVQRARVMNQAARFFQHVKGGLPDLPDLIIAQDTKEHRSVFDKR